MSDCFHLDRVYTDADWVQDIEFYAGNETTADPFAVDDSVVMTLVWAGVSTPKPDQVFELSTDAGSLVIYAPNRLGIRVPAAELEDILPGDWAFTIRKMTAAGGVSALWSASVPISRGLSQAADGPVVTGPSSGGNSGLLRVVRTGNGVRVVRAPGGPMGPQGKDAATVLYDAGLIDAPTAEAMAEWIQAQESISISLLGTFGPNELCARIAVPGPTMYLSEASFASCDSPATVESEFAITRNGDPYGSVTFPAGSGDGVVTLPAGELLATGDILRIVAPADVDLTLADVSIVLAGTS